MIRLHVITLPGLSLASSEVNLETSNLGSTQYSVASKIFKALKWRVVEKIREQVVFRVVWDCQSALWECVAAAEAKSATAPALLANPMLGD